jgi:TonB family protein
LRFDLDVSRLSPPHHAMLDEAARALRADPGLSARIVGHSDDQGPEPDNLKMSRERAEAAKRYLTGQWGIAPERIAPEGKGSLKPVASNETPQGRLRNRRVVVALRQASGAARRRQSRTWVLRFELDGAELSVAHTALLEEVAQELTQNPALEALVVGHSYNSSQEPINLQVSLQRAEAIKSYLTRRLGIDERRIRTRGKGSLRPVASNETLEGQRRNRRAVVVLNEPAAAQEPAGDEEAAAGAVTSEVSRAAETTAEEPPASTAPRQTKLLRPGREVRPPALLRLPKPVLTAEAKAPMREVSVTVAVLVSERGRVLAARIDDRQRVEPRFESAALEAAKGATFEPATRKGVAGRMWIKIVVTISLRTGQR